MTPNLKANVRPISFIFHNTGSEEGPVEVPLVIRPEDLTRSDTSRLNVTQTLGGAWVDNFGVGIPVVSINGHTGWGQGNRPDGLIAFQALYQTVFSRWHSERLKAIEDGKDPDKVKLLFSDCLDQFTWVVAPQNFTLKRSKSRPLLAQYSINMTWVSDDIRETLDALAAQSAKDSRKKERSGLDSLQSSLDYLKNLAKSFAESAEFLVFGPARAIVAAFTKLTANVLGAVKKVIESGEIIVDAVMDPLIEIGQNLARAGANILRSYQTIITFPDKVLAKVSRGASAFQNAFCIFRNILTRRRFLPDYNALYGASTCSSTVGGRPISKFVNENPFPELLPILDGPVKVTSAAGVSAYRQASSDPVLSPQTSAQMSSDMRSMLDGISIP